MCVCGYKLANSAMLKHFTTKNENLTIKGSDYFDRVLITKNKQATYFNKIVKLSDKSQITSYKSTELVAKKQKPHTIDKSHILPACCEIKFFSGSKMALII